VGTIGWTFGELCIDPVVEAVSAGVCSELGAVRIGGIRELLSVGWHPMVLEVMGRDSHSSSVGRSLGLGREGIVLFFFLWFLRIECVAGSVDIPASD
jgi:hypothetical protein